MECKVSGNRRQYKKKSAIYNILKLGNANLFKFEYYLKIWNIPKKLCIFAYEISVPCH